MKKLSINSLVGLIFFSSCCLFSNEARADIKLTVGNPQRNGKITIGITRPKPSKFVTVDLLETDDSEDKAEKIKMAFETEHDINIQMMGNMLIFPKSVKKVGLVDSTSESHRLETTNDQKPAKAKLDGSLLSEIQSTLSGLDDSGNESMFLASLGFETPLQTVSVSSELLFSELGGNTVDDWLSATFNDLQQQLPVIYQSNLSLNLDDDEILFNFPANIFENSGFVGNQATDTNSVTSLEIETTPEPSSLLGLLIISGLGLTLKKRDSFND